MALLVLFAFAVSGCARSKYRRAADNEAYCLIDSRQDEPLWRIPTQRVEPNPHSRMYFGADQDWGPKPEDDPAAQRYMQYVGNSKYYSKFPRKGWTENPVWIHYLPREENDKIKLTQPLAVDLALLHSREYQTQFENVYLSALNLSGNRFEFATQWFGGAGANFAATGEDLGNQRELSVTASRLGFSRNLAGGGQFATDVLNSLVWDFGTSRLQAGSASLVSTFTQPLLRGAFRHVRLESLTRSERNLLYSVRDFAHFRRTFYVDVVTSYLGLLTQVQALRNREINVENLYQSLEEHDFYVKLEIVSQIQRDQVFQNYQGARLSLLSAEQNFIASLDRFKFQLGLPPWVPFEIDESFLEPFELVDSELVELQTEAEALFQQLVQHLPPDVAPKRVLTQVYDRYVQLRDQVAEKLPAVQEEFDRWTTRLDAVDPNELGPDDRLDFQQQSDLAQQVRTILNDTRHQLDGREQDNTAVRKLLDQYDSPVPPVENPPPPPPEDGLPPGSTAENRAEPVDPRIVAWQAIDNAVGLQLRGELAELYVAQTLIRLFLIDIEPQQVDELSAITFAHQNRLDLMNSKANVMDAWRRVEVAADALQSDLTLTGSASLGSDPTRNNAFRFDANNNRYTVGVEFDGPLNRLNERNTYRASQIAYQRASRQFVADKDQVSNEVRSILRELELSRLSFQISRQQLVAATRQVEQAQIELRRGSGTGGEGSLTLLLLTALQGSLDAKNSLIGNWFNYRVQKLRLFAALEMLYLDENLRWLNEETGIDELEQFDYIDPVYFPPQWVSPADTDTELNVPVIEAESVDPIPPVPTDREILRSPQGRDS